MTSKNAPAERRLLTIVFSDLTASSEIAAKMEPEEYVELLQQLRDEFEKIIAGHGGELVRIDGDGALYIFGYPNMYEDSGRRATEAAIELHDATRLIGHRYPSLNQSIRLHTGIHSGVVLLRKGDLVRGRYEIIGNATNVTKRLCDLADSDQIFVGKSTLGVDASFFQSNPEQQVTLRGRRQPLSIVEILGRESIENRFTARIRRGITPFAGRKREMTQLAQTLVSEQLDGPQIINIGGPAGIGKTRLVTEFLDLAIAKNIAVHRSFCESYLGAQILQSFVQLVQSILSSFAATGAKDEPSISNILDGMESEISGPITQLLAVGSTGRKEAGLRLDVLANAIVKLLNRAASETAEPLILHIDDWQWADDASVAVFEMITQQVKRPVIFLLCTRVDGPLHDEMTAAQNLNLKPLSPEEAESAIGHLLPVSEPFVIKRVKDRSGGSPLFIEELCHALPHGDAAQENGDKSLWLDSMIQARFARLPDRLASLVRTASIIGHMIPHWLFEEMTGVASDAPELIELAVQDFIFDGNVPGTLRFKHGITREAIYDIIGLKDRQALHQKAANALLSKKQNADEEQYLEALAYHFGASGNPGKSLQYAISAGDKAMMVSALDRAQSQYRSALKAIESLSDDPELSILASQVARKYGQACVVDPSRDQLPVLKQAVISAKIRKDTEGLAWSEYWLGFIYYGLGEPRKSISHLQEAVNAAESIGNKRLLVTIRATLGQAYATACNYRAALPLLDEVIAVKRSRRKADQPSIILSYSLACRALVYADKGLFDKAYADLDEAIEVLAGIEHEMTASVLTLRCAACLWQGRYQEAYDLAIYSRGVAEKARARYIFVNCRSLAGYPLWCLKQEPAFLDQIIDATRWLEDTARQQFSSLNFGWLTEAMVSIKKYDDARGFAARAFLRARKGDRLGEAMAARAMAMAAAAGHGNQKPEYYLAIAHASADQRESRHERAQNQKCEAELAILGDDSAKAKRLLEAARSEFLGMAMDHQVKKITDLLND